MTDADRILIVEDEAIVAQDIQDILENWGYHIPSVAVSGEEAIKKAEETNPNLILMDIRLKGNIDGIEASSKIRNRFDIPIVYLTVYTDEQTLARVKKTEPFGYLLKPFNETELCMTIQTALHTHELQLDLKENQQRILDRLEETKHLSEIGTNAATIAHELRNPLGVMKIALFNIKSKNKNPTLENHLTNIEQKISESDQIVSNLLNFSQTKEPQYQKISILEILDECMANYYNKYIKWDVVIHKRYNCTQDDFICADPLHITQIFSNIINNTFQSFPKKKGNITIELDYKTEENMCCIIFQDDGIGINKKDLPKIFEPFFTTKAKGIGLGLSVCKQLVNLYGGKIDVASHKQIGTRFSVQLPIQKNP